MNNQKSLRFKLKLLCLLLFSLVACGLWGGDETIEGGIASRRVGSTLLSTTHVRPVAVGKELDITTTHTNPNNVGKVELFVDGNLVDTTKPAYPQSFFKVEHKWIPPSARTYQIKVVAYDGVDETNAVSEVSLTVTASDAIVPVATHLASDPDSSDGPIGGDEIACLNDATLVEDVTIPDNTEIQPNKSFKKTWRVKNIGTCVWGEGYYFDLIDGPSLGATRLDLDKVARGAEYDISLMMLSPVEGGTYRSEWRLFDAKNRPFGKIFFVQFKVPTVCQKPTIKQFRTDPSTILKGAQSTLIWEVEGANTITINPGSHTVQAKSTMLVLPTDTITYTLEAKDGLCSSTQQATITVNMPTGSPPAPSNLKIIEITQSSFTLSWQDNSQNETGFRLYDANTLQLGATYSANSTQGEITGLNCNTAYQWQLQSYNAEGESLASNVVSDTTIACD